MATFLLEKRYQISQSNQGFPWRLQEMMEVFVESVVINSAEINERTTKDEGEADNVGATVKPATPSNGSSSATEDGDHMEDDEGKHDASSTVSRNDAFLLVDEMQGYFDDMAIVMLIDSLPPIMTFSDDMAQENDGEMSLQSQSI